MKEENQMKIIKLVCGTILVIVYATTEMNGVILGLGAFLLGVPVEKLLDRYLKARDESI